MCSGQAQRASTQLIFRFMRAKVEIYGAIKFMTLFHQVRKKKNLIRMFFDEMWSCV